MERKEKFKDWNKIAKDILKPYRLGMMASLFVFLLSLVGFFMILSQGESFYLLLLMFVSGFTGFVFNQKIENLENDFHSKGVEDVYESMMMKKGKKK